MIKMRILEVGNLNRMGEQFALIFKELKHKADILLYSQSCKPLTTNLKYYNTYYNWENRFFHPLNEIPKTFLLYEMMWKLRKEYDLYHCQFALHSVLFANCIKKDIKYIAHVRGVDILYNPDKIYGFLLKGGLTNANMIWCSTPNLLETGKKYNKKTFWVPNIIKTEIYKPKKVKIFDKDKFNIFLPSRQLWSGSQTKDSFKAFFALKKILKHKKNTILHVVEHGSDLEKSKKLVTKLGIQKNVLWHTKTYNENLMVDMYNSADIVWDSFSVNNYAIGMVGFESMACNKPVLYKVVKDEWYPKNLPVIQAQTINQVVELTLNLPEHCLSPRKWIVKNFTFNIIKKKVKKLIEKYL